MTVVLGAPRSWLAETHQLDISHPKIHITALKLTQSLRTVREKACAIHDFVRRIPFGAYGDVSLVRASEVLRAKRGDCHSKGVLFVALCRAAQIPARLKFVRVHPRFLHGILDEGPDTMAHALGQVLIDDTWISSDGYVIDPVLFAQAKHRLRQSDAECGWGIVKNAQAGWNGSYDCIQQFDEMVHLIHDYGSYDDPAEFYKELSHDEGSPSWVARLKYSLGSRLVNRRVAKLRDTPTPAAEDLRTAEPPASA